MNVTFHSPAVLFSALARQAGFVPQPSFDKNILTADMYACALLSGCLYETEFPFSFYSYAHEAYAGHRLVLVRFDADADKDYILAQDGTKHSIVPDFVEAADYLFTAIDRTGIDVKGMFAAFDECPKRVSLTKLARRIFKPCRNALSPEG